MKEKEIATVVSEHTGLEIGEDHVHVSERRFYYTQEALPGCAYVLHHYRGVFFVEINKEDWKKIESGEVSVENFVDTTRWFFGYYWGGGSMCSGGFYTQLEKELGIHNKMLIQRVMEPLSKVGWHNSCGAKLTNEDIAEWKKVSKEYLHDRRVDFFKEVDAYVSNHFGYECKGFICGAGLPDNEIYLLPNSFSRNFEVMVGEDLIRKLLYGEEVPAVSSCNFIVMQGHYRNKTAPVTSAEEFQKALEDLEIIKEWEEYENRVKKNEERRNAAVRS